VDRDDLAYASIAEIAPRVRAGEVSPVELAEACLARIAALNGRVNAYLTVLADAALREARAAEAEIRAGRYRGPLHGIPIAHKDLYYTRGVVTTAGSKILADFVPTEDAAAVERLRAAGTVLLGKTQMHEFAYGGTNDNEHYGPTRNPWHLERIPGGSSGGSAAALAAGMCLGATGSDTAGSIRIPAHACGTTGIKPTYGRVSLYGVVPMAWSLDHPGPLARTAHDAALLLQAMAGHDPRDPASDDRPVPDFSFELDLGVRGLRLGIPRNYFTEEVAPDVDAAYRAAIRTLQDLGATVEDVEIPSLAATLAVQFAIGASECAAYHAEWLRTRPDDYGADVRARLEAGQLVPAVDYLKAQRYRAVIRAEQRAVLQRVDVLVTPTLPIPAPPIGMATATLGGRTVPVSPQLIRFTAPFDQSGFPAASVPCGFDGDGLPIGLQIAGRPWAEATVLRVAHAYQQATAWHTRRPPLPAS
jgi:aspartyl-tRNA(Asn)/glutamyl-tRNA(Gln) amidotransferase subunit A